MRLIAHRGYSAVAPENTRTAFEAAIRVGATALECDLQRTRDGRIIVLHDATLNRTTNCRGAVRRKTLAELRTVSFGYEKKFGSRFVKEGPLTFHDLLKLVKGRAHLYAEIKRECLTRQGDELREMLRLVRSLRMQDEVTFISFEWSALASLRSRNSDVHLGLLFDRYRPARLWTTAEKIRARFLIGQANVVEQQTTLVEDTHHRGMELGVYTVDDCARLRRLRKLGIDAAATNRVGELLLRFCEEMEQFRVG